MEKPDKMSPLYGAAVNEMSCVIHDWAISKGWWLEKRNDAEMIALMHSELSEALEFLRHGNPPSDHVPEISGVAEEMADTVIRIMDYCYARNINLGEAIIKKHAFNINREHRHGGKNF
jgi:NTP pyrophosphatase (non-canonical NTP hydrolase)